MNNIQQEFCNDLFNNKDEIVLLVDPLNGLIIDANTAACRFYGYEKDQFTKKSLFDISFVDIEILKERIAKVISKSQNRFSCKHILSDGQIKDVEALSSTITLNDKTALFIIIKDITEQKKNGEELSNFKKAVDTSGDIVFITDKEGIINYLNPVFELTYGYEKDEIIGKVTPRILKSGRFKDIDYSKIWNTLLNKNIYKGEFLNKSKDGRFVHIEASANPILDDKGEITGFLAIQKDITERKYFEKKLKENEYRFRRIFEEGPLGMALIGFDLLIITSNSRLEQILGYSTGELENVSINDISSPDDLSFDREQIKKIAVGEIPFYHMNNRYYKKNGEIVWVNVTVTMIRDNNENPLYFLIMVEDINEQKKTQEILLLSESRYRALAVNIPNSFVILFNEEFRIILAEGAELERIRKTKEYLEGKNILEVFSEKEFEKFTSCLQTVFEGEEHKYEDEKEGYYFEVNILPIKNALGKVGLGMVVVYNITERKKNEHKLKELLDSKDKFFSIIAHDLKSPFNSLIGFSEFLVNDFDNMPTDMIKSFVSNINKVAKGVFVLLENLLQWSMFQTGRLEFSPSKFKLDVLIEELHNIYNISALRKNIELKFDQIPGVFVFADRNMVFTILRNLISNSIKFTHSEGSVGVSIIEELHNVKIIVFDTGVGIRKEDIDNLFLLDKNVSRKGTDNETGTGLGLIICKEFIEKNNGSFAVESELNKGTKFIFTLPRN